MLLPRLSGLRTGAPSVTRSTTLPASLDLAATKARIEAAGGTLQAALFAAWARVLLEYTEEHGANEIAVGGYPGRSETDDVPRTNDRILSIYVKASTKAQEPLSNHEVIQGTTSALSAANRATNLLSDPSMTRGSFNTALALCEGQVSSCFREWFEANSLVFAVEVFSCADGRTTLRSTSDSGHIDPAAAHLLMHAFTDILTWMLEKPSEPFRDALAQTREEFLSAPSASDRTSSLDSTPGLLHSQFETFVSNRPHDEALVFVEDLDVSSSRNTVWTYEELGSRADAIAHAVLQSSKALKSPVIPIVSERCPELYAAVLGVLKAGKAWCPIDVLSPASRRRDLIARTRSRILVVTGTLAEQDQDAVPENVELLHATDILSRCKDDAEKALSSQPASTDDMAYLIWTSGTTGPPKGVPVSHRAAATAMRSLRETIPLAKRNALRCMQFSQYTFDVFVQDLFYTWGLGGALISARREVMVGSFAQLATNFGATHAHLTPAFGTRLSRASCPTLEIVTMIGEALPQHVADDWSQGMRAFNTYGPAEAAVVSTVQEFSGPGQVIKSTNVGMPLPSMRIYVLNSGVPVIKGSIGELGLAGPQLADGYFEDQEKTKTTFVDNEWLSERIYMTGDLVRQLPNGTLEFIGREDDLVKVNGIRIELSEISFAMRNCHSLVGHVETCHLTRAEHSAKSLVCFLAADLIDAEVTETGLVLRSPQAIEVANAAKKACRLELPDYMIPSVFVILQQMPRTPSAKIDRKALQTAYESLDIEEWESGREGMTDDAIPVDPQDPQCSSVLQILSSFCNVSEDRIQPSTSLRSLGIDSLAAMILSSRLRDTGLPINSRDVLSGRTVRDLLRLVKERGHGLSNGDADRFDLQAFHASWHPRVSERLSEQAIFVAPATPLQESLVAETLADRNAYWSNHLFELPADTDLKRLRRAWHTTAARTEALRTSFLPLADVQESRQNSGTTFLQLIRDRTIVDWKVHSAGTTATHDEIARDSASRVTSHHFETRFQEPPWAVSMMPQSDVITMMLTIHHILHDQDSIDLIIQSVRAAYLGQDDTTVQNHQLRDVLPIMLEPNEQSRLKTESFWCDVLQPFSDPDATSWPDLSGVRDPLHLAGSRALISHFRHLTTSKARLYAVAQSLSITPNSIIRAAWGFLILEYFDAEKCVLGEVRSERLGNPDLSDAVAPMVAVAPVSFRARDSLQEFLAEQFEWTSNALTHRSPPPALVRKLIERPRHLPLYASVFVYQNQKRQPQLHSFVGSWLPIDDPVGLFTEHPTAFNLYDEDSYYSLEIFAQASQMSRAQVELLALQLEAIIDAMVSCPDQSWSKLKNSLPSTIVSHKQSTLPQAREHGSLTTSTYWVDYYAEHQPKSPAVEVARHIGENNSPTDSWTFLQLQQRAEEIAHHLRSEGFSAAVIAMCAGRTLQSFAAILGIFKSGNTYLPIEENLPAERKELLLRDSCCVALLADESTRSTFGSVPSGCQLIDIESARSDVSSCLSLSSRDRGVDPDSNAYILYTSGSTGKPKGVLISHRNLCNFVEGLAGLIESWHPPAGALKGTGKFLGLASRAFDVHLCEMFVGWRLGLRTVTAPREALLNDLKTSLISLRVTHACFVPSLLDQSGLKPNHVLELVYFSVGGEKISSKTLATWSSQSHTLVVNAYGPTELAIGCCASRVHSRSNARNVGGPYGNTEVHVLVPGGFDYTLRGQAGELCFTGDLVGNGYFQRPDAEGFVDDFQGERMYRSGDIGRMMADGTLEFLGRDDDQTKIRGQRIELGEVTGTIRTMQEDQADAATMLLKHPALPRSQLISFVSPSRMPTSRYGVEPTLDREQEASASNIHDKCKRQLPAFMVPDMVIPVSVIPLAPISGKADTKLLKSFFERLPLETLVDSRRSSQKGSAQTRTLHSAENVIKDAICNSISTDELAITPDTNIFELGFDSLSVIGLCTRMRRLGFDCDVPTVLSHPVVHELGSLPRKDPTAAGEECTEADFSQPDLLDLEGELRSRLGAEREVSSHIVKIRPCLPLQEAMVAKSVNSPNEELYINRVVLRLEKDFDIDRFHAAFQKLVAANAILRTSFAPLATQIVQLTHAADSPFLGGLDLSYLSEKGGLEQLERKHAQITRQMLVELWDRPPFKAFVSRSSESGTYFLTFLIHHSLYDGASLRMLLNDLFARYTGSPIQPRTSLDKLIQFQVQQDREKQRSFWTTYLSGFRTAAVVTDSENSSSLQTETKLAISLTDLRHVSSYLKTTPSILLQFVFAVTISQLLEQDDVIFGTVLSGRTAPVDGVESIAGPCITTIPSRLRLPAVRSSLVEVLRSYHKLVAQCLEHQFTSLREIQRWMQEERQLFHCLFSYNLPAEPPLFRDCWTEMESSMSPDYPFAMEIEPLEESDSLISRIVLQDTPQAHQTIRMLSESFVSLLQGLSQGEEIHIAGRASTDASERSHDGSAEERNADPWGTEENIIKKIIVELLDIDEDLVTKDVSFFRLGIDSVSAIPLAHRSRQVGLPILSADVMRHTNIAALWEHTRSKMASKPSRNPDGREAHLRKSTFDSDDCATPTIDYPCTPLQSGMILATLSSPSNMYMHHHLLRLHDGINMTNLEEAWHKITAFHDVLRTSFYLVSETQSHWRAKVHPAASLTWAIASANKPLRQVLDDLQADMRYTTEEDFKAIPARATLVFGMHAAYLILSLHHALYDGNSIGLLLDNLACIYHRSEPAESRPFFEVAQKLAELEPGTADFWARSLEGYSVGAEDLLQVSHPHTVSIDRPVSVTLWQLRQGAQNLDVTPHAVIVLAFAKVLCSVCRRRDIVFGSVMSGRALPIEGIEDVVGPVFNTVPFRVTLGDRLQTNRSLAQQIQRFIQNLEGREVASLRQVQDLWRKQTQGPKGRLFNALLLYQRDSGKPSKVKQPWDIQEQSNDLASEYPFNFEVEQTSETLTMKSTSYRGFLSRTELDEATRLFEDCLLDIIDSPVRAALAHPPVLASLPLGPHENHRLSDPSKGKKIDSAELECFRNSVANMCDIEVDKLHADTNIFHLGIDSISAIKLVSKCREKGLFITVANALQGETLRSILKLRQESQPVDGEVRTSVTPTSNRRCSLPPWITQDRVEDVLPCLSGQTYHLILAAGMDRDSPWPTFAYETREKLDVPRFKRAWNQLCERHPILRTVFAMVSPSEAMQIVLKPQPKLLPLYCASRSTAALGNSVEAHAKTRFDVSAPPWKVTIVKGSESDIVLLTLHHALYDASSLPAMISDLSAIYNGQELKAPPAFAQYVRDCSSDLARKDEESFWKRSLHRSEVSMLQGQQSGVTKGTPGPPAHLVPLLETPLKPSQLQESCQRHGIPLPVVVTLAFARLVARLTETSHPTFGYYHASRSQAGAAAVVGPLLNMTPLVVPAALDGPTSETAIALRRELANRLPYEQSSLPSILKHIEMSDKPLFNMHINILWRMEKEGIKDGFMKPIKIALPHSSADGAVDTTVDGLRWPISEDGLWVDVVLNTVEDSVQMAAKCVGDLLGQETIEARLWDMSKEIEAIAAELSSG